MKRGELYRVASPGGRDPKASRVFVVVSRDELIGSKFPTVICAPVFSAHEGLYTQVPIGIEVGLKHESSIYCDNLMSLPKAALTNYVGKLPAAKLAALDMALAVALGLPL